MPADRRYPEWVRYSGMGLEFAGAVAGFSLIGYWIDRHYATAPWGVVVGSALGLIGGLYNLVKEALRAVHDADAEQAEQSGDEQTGQDA